MRQHRGRCSLAVCARYAYSLVVPACYKSEKLTALYSLHTACFCGDKLRVVAHYSRCVHNKICALNILGSLTHVYGYTHLPHRFKRFRFVIVRTCKIETFAVKYLRQRIHTASAYSDKMNVFLSCEEIFHCTPDPFSLTL